VILDAATSTIGNVVETVRSRNCHSMAATRSTAGAQHSIRIQGGFGGKE